MEEEDRMEMVRRSGAGNGEEDARAMAPLEETGGSWIGLGRIGGILRHCLG
jgi:hypothetical protein